MIPVRPRCGRTGFSLPWRIDDTPFCCYCSTVHLNQHHHRGACAHFHTTGGTPVQWIYSESHNQHLHFHIHYTNAHTETYIHPYRQTKTASHYCNQSHL